MYNDILRLASKLAFYLQQIPLINCIFATKNTSPRSVFNLEGWNKQHFADKLLFFLKLTFHYEIQWLSSYNTVQYILKNLFFNEIQI